MEKGLNIITEADYQNDKSLVLFNEGNVVFGRIKVNDIVSYKLSWQSELVTPFILKEKVFNNEIICIGIDTHCVIIDVQSAMILLSIGLNSNFSFASFYKESLFIATELDVMVFNIENYSVRMIKGLPDIFSEIDVENGVAKVTCLDGSVEEFNYL